MKRYYRTGQVRAIPKEAQETREIEFIISTEQVDRHNTILKIDKWNLDSYEKNPIVGYMHNLYGNLFKESSPNDVIGYSKVWIEDSILVAKALFETKDINPLADTIFKKLVFGSLRSASVGFLGDDESGETDEKTGAYIYPEQELAEWSVINIPSNTGAVKRHLENAQ